jgi:predicted metal-dependent hydrolase
VSIDIETTISDVNIFLEKLREDLPEVFKSLASKEAESAPQNGKVLYLGGLLDAEISLDACAAANSARAKEGKLKIILKSASQAPSQIAESWLREEAARLIPERAKFWAEKMGVQYNKIVIKDQKTMWASCSSKQNLNYSYRIVKMPSGVIDYLIVHELAHLIHFNHGAEYWAAVASFIPDYKTHRKWLNANKYAVMADLDLKAKV